MEQKSGKSLLPVIALVVVFALATMLITIVLRGPNTHFHITP